MEPCRRCRTAGSIPNPKTGGWVVCPACRGTGRVR